VQHPGQFGVRLGQGRVGRPGRLAGQTAADAISAGDVSANALMAYDRGWRTSKLGKSLERNYKVKEYFLTLSDDKLNRLVHSISKVDLAKFSVLGMVTELVKHDPSLLLELRALRNIL